MICPHCDKDIPDTEVAKHLAAKGGRKHKIGKARSDELIAIREAKRKEREG